MTGTGSPAEARLFDARGCLGDAGLDALLRSPAGRGPQELAAHLAGCPRCQDRLLARDRAATSQARRKSASAEERLVRTVLVLVVLVVAALAGAWCLARRVG
jgi:hypothetical protein